MEMHQIRYFLAVCETRHFTRAAERCNVSQPSLTTAIKRLEQELEAPLFHRERSGAKLTTLGELVRPSFERLAAEQAAIVQISHDHRRLRNVPLRIGVLSTIGPSRLADDFERFHRRTPGVDLELQVGQQEELLARLEEADLEVVISNLGPSAPEWLATRPLYSERYQVVLPPDHPLGAREEVSLGALSGQPYIDRLQCELREHLSEACAERGVELYASYRTEREAWIECMVRSGVGFAFMPEYSVVGSDTLHRPLVEPEVVRTISLLRSAERPMSAAAQSFWAVLFEA